MSIVLVVMAAGDAALAANRDPLKSIMSELVNGGDAEFKGRGSYDRPAGELNSMRRKAAHNLWNLRLSVLRDWSEGIEN